MHPIFFTWSGTYDDLVAETALHQFGRTRTVAIEHGKAYIGIIEARTASVRKTIDDSSSSLTVLPSANGVLSAKHVKSLATVAPDLKIKEGDSMRVVLSYVLGLYNDSEFDPDAY